MITIKEFAQELSGKEYDCCMFMKKELQIAKDNGWVIVTGASDDLMEFEGAMDDEGGCFNGGKVFFSKDAVWNGDKDKSGFQNCIEAIWCGRQILNESGNVIPWTYKTDIPHETFWVYEDGETYCRGLVFSVTDLK